MNTKLNTLNSFIADCKVLGYLDNQIIEKLTRYYGITASEAISAIVEYSNSSKLENATF